MIYSINISQSIWRTTFSETLTDRDLAELVLMIGALRESDIARNGLVDLRTLSDMDIDYTTLNTIALERQSHGMRKNVRTAIITLSPVQYGIARMFQRLLNGRERDIRVFEDEPDALDWLQSDGSGELVEKNSVTTIN